MQFHSRIGLLFLCITVASSLTVLSANPNLSSEIFSQGLNLYSIGDYRGAADYLSQVVSMAPQHDQARYYLIYSYTSSGQYKKALEHAKILSARFPQNTQYSTLLKQIDQQLKLSFPSFAESTNSSISPDEPEIDSPAPRPRSTTPQKTTRKPSKIEQAISLIDEEKYASATVILQEIISREPKNSPANHYLGLIFFNQGDSEKAKSYLEKALSADYKNFEARFLAGLCYFNQHDWKPAESFFLKALEVKDDIFCKMNLAEIYLRSGRFKEAEVLLKEIQKKSPDIAEAGVLLAEIKIEQGFSSEAIKTLNKILSHHPENARAHYAKAKILLDNKLYNEAVEEARFATDSNPGNPDFRSRYALCLIRNFNLTGGMEEATAVINRHPGHIGAILSLAEGKFMSGDLEGATLQLQTAEKYGHWPETSLLQASIATQRNDLELARKHYSEFLKRSGNRPAALIEFARFLETHGSLDEAKKTYQNIIKADEKSSYAEEAQTAIDRLKIQDNLPPVKRIGNIPIPGLNNL